MKKFQSLASILGLLVALILFPHPIEADSAPVQIYSGGVVTYEPNGISLVREDLKIKVNDQEDCILYADSYKYCTGAYAIEASFVFDNPSSAKSIDTFFPIPLIRSDEDLASAVTMEFNGEPVADLTQKEFTFSTPTLFSSHSSFAVFTNLSFREGENQLTVRYRQALNPSLSRKAYERNIQYILTSGGLWEGPIQELNIDIDFGSATGLQRYRLISDQYYFEQKTDSNIVYKGFNIDPYQELNIDFITSDIWNRITPFLDGREHSISFDERRTIYDLLARSLKNAKSGSLLPALNRDKDIIFDIFRSNTFVLVEDGYANTEAQQWYANYWLSRIGVYPESKSIGCPKDSTYLYQAHIFEPLKQTVIYKLTHYLNVDEFKTYIDQAQSAVNYCLSSPKPTGDYETIATDQVGTEKYTDTQPVIVLLVLIFMFSTALNMYFLRYRLTNPLRNFYKNLTRRN